MRKRNTNNKALATLAKVSLLTTATLLSIANAAVTTPEAMVAKMGIGINATWSEFPSRTATYTTQQAIDYKIKGFDHARLRVNEESVDLLFPFLDGHIQDALDNNLIPIIANQSHTFEDTPTAETQADWVQWWHDVALHYKDYPHELMFDLIVEIAASSPLSDAPINQLNEAYEQAVTAIRSTGGNNANRIIIFSAPKRSDPTRMSELDIPTQGNGYLIAEFHEGYASGPSPDPTNPHYWWDGTAAESALISQRIDAALLWSATNNIPLWQGAWMPGNYNKGDDYSVERQIAFSEDMISQLQAESIPFAINASHKFYDADTNSWNVTLEPVVDAIVDFVPPVVENDTLFADDFESGTLNLWAASGTSASASSSASFTGSYGVMLKATSRIKATVSTVNYSEATLCYDRITSGLDSGEYLKAEYSIDAGNTFIALALINDTAWANECSALPQDALGLSDLIIKFATTANKNNEKGYVDNVVLTGK